MIINVNSVNDILKERGLEEGGEVQKIIDNDVIRFSKPYMPKDNNISIELMDTLTVVGSGEIKTGAPYDARNYYNPQFDFQGNTGSPARGGYWFERMKTDRKDDILNDARVASGGK